MKPFIIHNIVSVVASIGFVLFISTFIAGFRMVKRSGLRGEGRMHRVNGFITMGLYLIVAAVAISHGTSGFYLFAWFIGLVVHFLKLLIVRKGLAVRYGGYFGALLLIVWLTIIFTHLPK
ncbi:MAG: hypothetical protein V3T30_03100 [Thermodesulfobacteriota bacterium]